MNMRTPDRLSAEVLLQAQWSSSWSEEGRGQMAKRCISELSWTSCVQREGCGARTVNVFDVLRHSKYLFPRRFFLLGMLAFKF